MAYSTQIILEHLTASGTDLYASVGDRINMIGVDKTYENKPFIVMVRRGGGDMDRVPITNTYMQFKVYGGQDSIKDNGLAMDNAIIVYEQLKAVLHNINMVETANGVIVHAFEQQQPQDLVEPDSKWPYVLAFYDIATR